ncbi:hypothetical protein Msi02_85110 [Microbispora siamensis]|uniref:Uncharacterized protein n=1 Tax=Microbispora siamensis TaxID=564413 RepID=A0ABQ4H2C0_9ACTN|nr:hypothetical protein Msi02_85110 [Microbispora siamensis]
MRHGGRQLPELPTAGTGPQAARPAADRAQGRETRSAALDGGKLLDAHPGCSPVVGWSPSPPELLPQLREHVERYSDKAAGGWVFIGPKDARLRRSSPSDLEQDPYGGRFPDLHIHDLRHMGKTLAPANGASLKEPMARMRSLVHSGGPDLPARPAGS